MREVLLAAYCFAIGVAFWPGTAGGAISPRWALIGAGIWLFVRPVEIAAGHFVMVLLVGWGALSLTWSAFPLDGIDALCRLIFLTGAFFVGSSLTNLRPVYAGFALALGVSSVIAIAQTFWDWQGVFHASHGAAGLFVNKNSMAEIAALVLIGVLVERMWWLVPLILPAALLPVSRTTLLALAVSGLVALRSPLAWFLVCFGLSGVAVFVFDLGWWPAIPNSLYERLSFWGDTVRNLNVMGHGLGSFNGLYPSFATADTLAVRTDHVHNDYIEWVFELGAVGAALLAALVVCLVRGRAVRCSAGCVAVALGVEMLLAFPLHLPCTAFLGALVLGHLAGNRDRVWVGVPSRGGTVPARSHGSENRTDRAGGQGLPVPALDQNRSGL